jgi:hypothetical protein
MYKITRINDGKTFETEHYKFVVFENGRGKELIDNPEIETALILPPYNSMFRWMTTEIIEIINDRHFKTKNSEYEIKEI